MRTLMTLGALAFFWLVAQHARAFDGYDHWYSPANAAIPGAGGVTGTGARSDYAIHCGHCHIDAPGMIDASVTFNPPLTKLGNDDVYAPGQAYQVTVNLLGEYLGRGGVAECGQYGMNINQFAAKFEDADGNAVGSLVTDSGLTSANCVPMLTDKPPGTVMTYGDCKAAIAIDNENRTMWTFQWTAPAGGEGALTMYYGVTDGNCSMDSYDDDTIVATVQMAEATAAAWLPSERSSSGSRHRYALVLVPLLFLTRRLRWGIG